MIGRRPCVFTLRQCPRLQCLEFLEQPWGSFLRSLGRGGGLPPHPRSVRSQECVLLRGSCGVRHVLEWLDILRLGWCEGKGTRAGPGLALLPGSGQWVCRAVRRGSCQPWCHLFLPSPILILQGRRVDSGGAQRTPAGPQTEE